MGFQAATGSPAAFAKFLNDEIAKWARVVRDAGIQPE
jgi:tripartite-type tricarboxylate transporter receptor subunit TctC